MKIKLASVGGRMGVDVPISHVEALLDASAPNIVAPRGVLALVSVCGARSLRFEHDVAVTPCAPCPLGAQDGTISVEEIYGLDALRLALERYGELVAMGLLPFAEAAGGNVYCVRAPRNDVVLWDHDSEPTMGLYVVARDVEEFVSALLVRPQRPGVDQGIAKVTLKPWLLKRLQERPPE